MRDLPYLVSRFRAFLHGLDGVERRVERRSAPAGTPAAPVGDTTAVRAAVAALLAAETASALEAGVAADSEDLRLALALMARAGDAAFAHLPAWGHGSAPPLAADYPLPGPASLAERVDALLDAEEPRPDLARLHLLALVAGIAATEPDPAARQELEASRPALARLAAGGEAAADDTAHLFPAAYPAPRRHGPAREMPQTAGWLAAVPAALALLLAVTLLTWWGITHGLEEVVCDHVARWGR